jgi:hypothetical protein
LLLLGLAAACSSKDSTSPAADPWVGTWHVTSFIVPGLGDVIANGMTLTGTLNNDGTYSLAYANDQVGACNNSSSCTRTGNYSHSGNTIIIDSGTADATTFNYTISGSTMTWTGTIDGTPVTITMVKA